MKACDSCGATPATEAVPLTKAPYCTRCAEQTARWAEWKAAIVVPAPYRTFLADCAPTVASAAARSWADALDHHAPELDLAHHQASWIEADRMRRDIAERDAVGDVYRVEGLHSAVMALVEEVRHFATFQAADALDRAVRGFDLATAERWLCVVRVFDAAHDFLDEDPEDGAELDVSALSVDPVRLLDELAASTHDGALEVDAGGEHEDTLIAWGRARRCSYPTDLNAGEVTRCSAPLN